MSIIVKILIVIGIIISVILLIILAIILYPFKYEFNSSYKDKEFKIDFKYFIITFFTNINIGFPVKYTLQIFNKVLFDSEKKLEKSQNNEFDDKKHDDEHGKDEWDEGVGELLVDEPDLVLLFDDGIDDEDDAHG